MLLVQCDFDDTVAADNVSTAIRVAFAPDEWRAMEEEYYAGKYSVEESNVRQFRLIRASKRQIEDFVNSHVMLRAGFGEFVDYCRSHDVRVAVVSSGLDLYVAPSLRQSGIDAETYAGKATITPEGIHVEYVDPQGTRLSRGFKEACLRYFKAEGYTVAYVGDGMSDITPATEADYVIARSSLRQHFRAIGLECYGFEDFHDVRRHIEEIRHSLRE